MLYSTIIFENGTVEVLVVTHREKINKVVFTQQDLIAWEQKNWTCPRNANSNSIYYRKLKNKLDDFDDNACWRQK